MPDRDTHTRERNGDKSRAARLNDNVWFVLLYRVSGILFAWIVAFAMFFGSRTLTAFDETVKIVAETTKEIAVIKQVTLDHGGRLGRIERRLDKDVVGRRE